MTLCPSFVIDVSWTLKVVLANIMEDSLYLSLLVPYLIQLWVILVCPHCDGRESQQERFDWLRILKTLLVDKCMTKNVTAFQLSQNKP